jgi:hypothetical protein
VCWITIGVAPQDTGVAALEGPGSGIERVGFHEKPTALPKQVFTVRRQSKAAPNPVEEAHTQLVLERENLARGGRLAHIQPSACPSNAAGFGRANEGLEVAQVHRFLVSILA